MLGLAGGGRGAAGAAGPSPQPSRPSCASRLENCGLTAASCEDLCRVVAAKPSLQILDLGDNKLGDEGIATLCSSLLQSSCQIQVLR